MIHLTDEELQDRADGLLPSGKTREFETHLKLCSECRDKLQGYSTVRTGLLHMKWGAQPQDVETPVMLRIMKLRSVDKSSVHFIAFIVALFALLITGSVVGFFMSLPAAHTVRLETIPLSSYREILTSVIIKVVDLSGYLFTAKANYVILAILSILLFMSLDFRKTGKNKSV